MVNIIGLSCIGLSVALMLAAHGVKMVGVGRNEKLIATPYSGKMTFKEDGLCSLFEQALKLNGKIVLDISNIFSSKDFYKL